MYASSNNKLKSEFKGVKSFEYHDTGEFNFQDMVKDLIRKDRQWLHSVMAHHICMEHVIINNIVIALGKIGKPAWITEILEVPCKGIKLNIFIQFHKLLHCTTQVYTCRYLKSLRTTLDVKSVFQNKTCTFTLPAGWITISTKLHVFDEAEN